VAAPGWARARWRFRRRYRSRGCRNRVWPRNGIPDTPEAWLLTVARRKVIDAARRRRAASEAAPTLALLVDELDDADRAHEIPDERLRLMFVCAHPAIDAGVRAPLMLQTVLGFDAATIASAFLVAAEGLAALDALNVDTQLAEYQPYWAARAALPARSGDADAASEAYRRAIGLESDPAVRRFLQAELARAQQVRAE